MIARHAAALMFLGCLSLVPAPAIAASDMVVMQDQAKMLSLTGEAATVVVGNPSIADVSVQGTNVFVHGRSYGTTNVIVLDGEGNQLAMLDVTVMKARGHGINVFRAGAKYSYACAPTCESTPEPGDQKDYFSDTMGHIKVKSDNATGTAKATATQ